ncbi:penicillin amidase [Saccharopolyspora antimicrobica]|uniref:Penicillin amidase n=1 Tax=Saccharopolyspora antimicrobica TaxID=455193 RepID=A0A1I4THE2_9PSEU|nr:penicillin acylase family protein [Saccharopolyspora antimicrobica]RKT85719.1 penicillin amidase [Saccharopolyspora antimicrobica]SFM76071.1 penicillin amidase [Saccharopolyspora antimicrobica]
MGVGQVRFSRRQGLVATAAGIAGAGVLTAGSGADAAPDPVKYPVRGLREPVELIEDRYGVPHIYARNEDDVFLAQGFNAARERLFQIDLWRRRGLGKLAEVLGPDHVPQDRATRLFLYRGDMDVEWARYSEDAQRIATRFTAGINAYLDWLDEHPDQLPEEFGILGYRPARWEPEDVVRIRSHGLTRNLTSEVKRAQVACAAGVDADQIRQGLQPEHRAVVPEGFDPCALPEDVLEVFDLATQQVEFAEGRVRKAVVRDPATEGSNNWVISGARTATGRPILANDPHRAYSAPSLRYLAHLSAPGLDVIGAGEPALPGISIGHNGTVAFGLTIFPMDQEDLYVYELDPADRRRYRYQGGWESMSVLREEVEVRGEAARTVELAFTRHGPVIHVDEQRNLGYAVRTGWLEPGMSPYFGSVAYMRARNFAEFTRAMRNWGAPTENQVYADVEGNIGWVPGGLAPKRVGYDGLLPVPGDGRYEWNGFHSGDDLPRSLNPEAGFIATANQFNLPPEHQGLGLGYEWTNPFRHQRIVEVLSRQHRHTIADSQALQNDQLSIPARRLIALLSEVDSGESDLRRALRLLRGWDAVESPGSGPAALFEVWLSKHLGPGFVRAAVPEAAGIIADADTLVMLGELENPGRWLPDLAARDRLLLDTLRTAYAEVRERLGRGEGSWQWGKLQHSFFPHPASAAFGEAERARFDVGPLPRGGSADTVNQSSYRTSDFRQLNGPSFRMVLDVGDWDSSVAVNTPGQSGDPNSPHYRDLAERWRTGKYFPLAYSRQAVERIAERRMLLLPA